MIRDKNSEGYKLAEAAAKIACEQGGAAAMAHLEANYKGQPLWVRSAIKETAVYLAKQQGYTG